MKNTTISKEDLEALGKTYDDVDKETHDRIFKKLKDSYVECIDDIVGLPIIHAEYINDLCFDSKLIMIFKGKWIVLQYECSNINTEYNADLISYFDIANYTVTKKGDITTNPTKIGKAFMEAGILDYFDIHSGIGEFFEYDYKYSQATEEYIEDIRKKTFIEKNKDYILDFLKDEQFSASVENADGGVTHP